MGIETWGPWMMVGSAQVKRKIVDGWLHMLIAPPDEMDPDRTHVHAKCAKDRSTPVLCSVKTDGHRYISRRELIEKVNAVTGFNLPY